MTLALLTDRIEDAFSIAQNEPELLFRQDPNLNMRPSEVARANVSAYVANRLEEMEKQFSSYKMPEVTEKAHALHLKIHCKLPAPQPRTTLSDLYFFHYVPPVDYFDALSPVDAFLTHMPHFAASYCKAMDLAFQKILHSSSNEKFKIKIRGTATFKKRVQQTLTHLANTPVGNYIISRAGPGITIEESSRCSVNSSKKNIAVSLDPTSEVVFNPEGKIKKAWAQLDSVLIHEMVHIIQKLEGRTVEEGWHPLMKNTKEEEAIFFENLFRHSQSSQAYNLFHVGWNHYHSFVSENSPLMHFSQESYGLDRDKVFYYKNKGHQIDALNRERQTLLSLIMQAPLSVERKKSDMLFLLEEGSDPFIADREGISAFLLGLKDLELAFPMLEDLIENGRLFDPNLVSSHRDCVNRSRIPYLRSLFEQYLSLCAGAAR